LAPEDEVRLHPAFHNEGESDSETRFSFQARPNVLFEMGMAMALFPDSTIIVELGNMRPFSDVDGRHVIRLNDSTEMRQALALRLRTAKCLVDLDGTDWHRAGRFNELNEVKIQVTSRGILRDKSGNLFWLTSDLIDVMAMLYKPEGQKDAIVSKLGQCHHHAKKLEINERDVIGRLKTLQDQVAGYSEESWLQKREICLREFENIYDHIRQLVQDNQPDFEPWPKK
jgi:hypothetical protein